MAFNWSIISAFIVSCSAEHDVLTLATKETIQLSKGGQFQKRSIGLTCNRLISIRIHAII